MKLKKRRIVLVLILVGAGILVWANYPKLNIISGFASKNLASAHFISGRLYTEIIETDNDMPLIKMAELEKVIGDDVTSSVFGLMERETVCRDGLGCVLINESYDKTQVLLKPKRTRIENNLPFPYGNKGIKDTVFANVDYERLHKAVDFAFSDYENQKTRTVLIAHKNELLTERYIEGFSEKTPVLGWSMTKSVLATVYGILEHQNKISMDFKPFAEDVRMKDLKHTITLNHLLRMQSGLEWDEDYASISDVNKMLFLEADMTKPQRLKQSVAAPTEVWNYSSGTTNLLSGILREHFDSYQEYLDFPYTDFIDKMGMHSMLIETDMSGNFVGSSYAWATTRDWAKFGLLYLNKGNWNGEQLFSPAWSDYVSRPTKNSDGVYGAHFWLNAGGKYPDVPRDLYSANGFQGQRVYIIPSKDLVVVRTGLANEDEFDVNTFLSEVCKAIK
ncbi:serine hydrolase [Maribacter sp. 4U21]|uniref:serine hydrolase domain-containing protein n=1 Tax=Maribacter sp. 4U21 TaxID=1889779 RepID=UPI000C15B77B|nr:serine hydrolase [Maribacter sp. 4U21]PIB23715.1 serine hydrolase [Maribacter sp. 4U21]